jgi:hypothetical protein
VHVHVPVYLREFGHLHSSQDDIDACLRVTLASPEIQHYEVETYAWNVLPTELQQPTLAAGIAQEMEWFRRRLADHRAVG